MDFMNQRLQLIFIWCVTALVAYAEIGVVTATRLNVRARPGTQYEVVCQVVQNEELEIRERKGDWVGVAPPKSAKVWIDASHLDGDRVMAAESKAYAGAATVFSVIGSFKENDTVKVFRTRQDGWAEVSPPGTSVLWIHKNYLRPPSPPEPEPETVVEVAPDPVEPPKLEPPAPKPGETDHVSVKPNAGGAGVAPPPIPGARDRWEPKPDEVHIHRITANPPKGKPNPIGEATDFTQTGMIIPLNDENTPWDWAIAVKVNDTYYPLGYLAKGYAGIEKWRWRDATVVGKRQWVRGWPRPQITIETLQIAE